MTDHYNHKWVRTLTGHGAITLFGHAFYAVSESQVSDVWHKHENCHKKQQADEPFLFYIKYVFFIIIRGYTYNPYEIEARLAEKK